jgi:hypothetical protein
MQCATILPRMTICEIHSEFMKMILTADYADYTDFLDST